MGSLKMTSWSWEGGLGFHDDSDIALVIKRVTIEGVSLALEISFLKRQCS